MDYNKYHPIRTANKKAHSERMEAYKGYFAKGKEFCKERW